MTVDTGKLLDQVRDFLERFVVFQSRGQVVAVALWVLHTWTIDSTDCTAYLIISSPEKRSGKTRLLDVLELLVRKPWRAITPSEAVLFRKIEQERPTLLLDEYDALFGKDKSGQYEPQRALLNAGHRRGTTVPRCETVGKTITVKDFEPYCAKALAGIGRLPDTVSDRGITIGLQRRRPGEVVERFRYRDVHLDAVEVTQALEVWAQEATESLTDARPSLPLELDDRAQDGWEHLLAIADLAGEEWGTESRRAAIELTGEKVEDETIGVLLLAHVREAFGDGDRATTDDLLHALTDRDDGPWPTWWGAAVDKGEMKGPAAKLARLLKPFGIRPKKIRLDQEATARGYVRTDLEQAWNRYCPPLVPRNMEHGTFEPEKSGSDLHRSVVPSVPSFSGNRGEDRNEESNIRSDNALPPCEICGEPCSFEDERGRRIHVGCAHPGTVSVKVGVAS